MLVSLAAIHPGAADSRELYYPTDLSEAGTMPISDQGEQAKVFVYRYLWDSVGFVGSVAKFPCQFLSHGREIRCRWPAVQLLGATKTS